MATLQIGRLLLGQPSSQVAEPLGDPVGAAGAVTVAAPRTPMAMQVQINTLLSGATTFAQAQALRRQFRSMMNNTALKLQNYLYILYSDDPEQNGWIVPTPTTIAGRDATSWKAGLWETQSMTWNVSGRQRTHREARSVWTKDLTTGLYERDSLGMVISQDFVSLPKLALSVLPSGATSIRSSNTGQVVPTTALPAGRDGGISLVAVGRLDLDCISFERLESAMGPSDVIVYDRRGQITAPSTGPGTLWEEAYGPDHAWNWLTAGQPSDCPVLDNGLVRVRYDTQNSQPGICVDVWNGSSYVEQGKMTVYRLGDTPGYDTQWATAGLLEYTHDRAVMRLVLASTDAYSREDIYVTVQRGAYSATFECYPPPLAVGTPADAMLVWNPTVADANISMAKIDSTGATALPAWTAGTPTGAQNSGPSPGKIAATAGTGTALFSSAALGNANFATSENWVAMLRCSAVATVTAFQTNFAVLQAAGAGASTASDATAYGTSRSQLVISGQQNQGYVSVEVSFAPAQLDQVLEVETGMTLGSGTSNTVDAAASNGRAATAVRTTDANAHATRATWPNAFLGTFRVFLRVKVSAGTGSFYVKTGATTGATVTTTSTSYVWVDCGEIVASNSTLEVHAWTSTGTVSVDRLEAFLVQDRTRTSAIYSGARDLGQSALIDSRMIGTLVGR